MMKMTNEIEILIQSIDSGYRRKSWHGTNLLGSVRGLKAKEAAFRPGNHRHNIWEIILHCAYWKYIVRRRIFNEKRGTFPLKGSDWFPRPEGKPIEKEWKKDVKLLDDMHNSMIEAISILKDTEMLLTPHGSKFNNRSVIIGIAMHDVYHAGQIQLIKRLLRTG